MTAKIIDGRTLSKRVRQEYRDRIQVLAVQGLRPGLAVVLVGEDPASRVYVGNKTKACEEIGIESTMIWLPETITEEQLIAEIQMLNHDDAVDGILVQLPLPKHINNRRVLETISKEKDVDGFHLYNVGSLVVGKTIFPPCTPYGVTLLLESEGINVSGLNVVIVGASNIVGKPMALMMMQQGATVSVCHALTRDLAQYTIIADVLIVAAGVPGLITAPMIKRGCVVIDVGINKLADGSLTGDVDFAGVRQKASHITPVPGGVGPMTVTMLLKNTISSAERRAAQRLAIPA